MKNPSALLVAHVDAAAVRQPIGGRHPVPVRMLALLLASSLAAILLWSVVSATGAVLGAPAYDRIYTVQSLRASLARDSLALLGHTVRVHASVGLCTIFVSRCFDWQPALVDSRGVRVARPFALGWAAPSPLWTLARRIPLLSRIVPPPRPVELGVAATYTVTLHAMAGTYCGAGPCVRADLVDAGLPSE